MVEDHTVWIEKYRPKTFEEIKGQESIVQKVKAFIGLKNIPHLLFAGPAGVGKSTLALVIAKQFFGTTGQQNFLELNASDERGIDVIRNTIKNFARVKALGDVPFKIIFLDECDALTNDAQQALRRTMENYTRSTRFILSCNYVSKLIDPIQSRCVVFKFRPLEKEHLMKMVNTIEEQEQLSITPEAKNALCDISNGDCRRLENILQSCAAVSKDITPEVVYSLAAVAKPEELGQVITKAVNGDFSNSRRQLLDIMLKYGLSGIDIVKQLSQELWNCSITEEQKMNALDKLGDIEFRMVEGSDEFIQLEAYLAYLGLLK